MLTIDNDDFIKLVKFIKDRYGINLAERKVLVESRLSNHVLDYGFDNFADYLNLVYNDSTQREVANMINRLTTNHTYFMRETAHFQHMMEIFLPYAEKNIKDKTGFSVQPFLVKKAGGSRAEPLPPSADGGIP